MNENNVKNDVDTNDEVKKREESRFEKFSKTIKDLLNPIDVNCQYYNLYVGLRALYSRAKDFDLSKEWKEETNKKMEQYHKKATEELEEVNKRLDSWFFDYTKATLLYCETEKAIQSNKDVNDEIVNITEKSNSTEFHNKCIDIAKKIRKWTNTTQIGMNYEMIFETISLFA